MYYHTLNEELRRRFGCKVYKLALDGGFTCPNRDYRCARLYFLRRGRFRRLCR